MSTYNLIPETTDFADAGWTSVGAGTIHQAIDDTPGSHDGDSTYTVCNSSGSAQTFRVILTQLIDVLAVNKITLHMVAREPGAAVNQQPFLWIGGTRYNGTVRALTASYVDYTDVWSLNPATGLPWTKAQLDNLIAGVEQQLNATQLGRVTSLWVEVDYTPIPVGISPARDIGTHDLRLRRRQLEVLPAAEVPLEFLDLEILDDASVVYDGGPHAQGLGWGLQGWERRLFQFMTEEIDPGTRRLRLGFTGRRGQLFGYLDHMESRRSSSPLEDGVARLTSGNAPVFTRVGNAYIEDPGSGLVVQIGENQKPIAKDGMLFENFTSQRCKRSSFVSGTAGLTLTPGPNGATIAAETPAQEPLFDPTVSNSCLLFTAGSPHSGNSDALWPDSGNFTANSRARVSVDHKDDSGATLHLQVRRTNDGQYWNDATPGWQAGLVNNALPVRTSRDRDDLKLITMPGVAAGLTIRLLQLSGGTASRKNRVYHVQAEEGDGLVTSRIVTEDVQLARQLMTHRVSNPSGKRILNRTRGTFFCEFRPLWNTADAFAHYVFFKSFFSVDEAWNLYHDFSNDVLAFQARTGAVTYEATKAAAFVRGTWYKIAARWTSTAGELGLPARTLSVFIDAVKGTDVVRGGDPTEASDIDIGVDSAGNSCNAQIRRLFFTPEVYPDEMIARL